MKIKKTLFTTRNNGIYNNYTDTNSLLFIILFKSGAELSFILRNLKKNNNIESYIYKKLNNTFGNIAEIETSRITNTEYNLLKQLNTPSITKLC
tara:strand:+ start:1107 stop:1388 length:282 start_codon:yes stop_codon:yes gene_type:complete